jgi:hypothetical protein
MAQSMQITDAPLWMQGDSFPESGDLSGFFMTGK